MCDIQEQIQNSTNILELQDTVVSLRKLLPTVYEGYLKKQIIASTEKTIRAKVIFEVPKLTIPEMENIDINSIKKQSKMKMNIDEIYQHAQNIEECLQYLSRHRQQLS